MSGKILKLVGGLPVMQDLASDPYDESEYFVSGLAADTPITLPNSGTFTDDAAKDIIIIVNSRVVEEGRSFEVVGASAPYTQIKFTEDLPVKSVVRFKKLI